MDNNEFLVIQGTLKNIREDFQNIMKDVKEDIKYIRTKQDTNDTKFLNFQKDISMDLQQSHMMFDKKLDMFIENQKNENKLLEEKIKDIHEIKERLPNEKLDFNIVKEIIEHYKDNKDFIQKVKLGIKEKLVFAGFILVANLGLLFLIKPILIKLGVDVTKLFP
jgi:acetone carboxylase gamma subunit